MFYRFSFRGCKFYFAKTAYDGARLGPLFKGTARLGGTAAYRSRGTSGRAAQCAHVRLSLVVVRTVCVELSVVKVSVFLGTSETAGSASKTLFMSFKVFWKVDT